MIFHLLKKGTCREKKADLRTSKLPLHLNRQRLALGLTRFVARWVSAMPLFTSGVKKYGGLGPSELRKLKQLEEENSKLKRIVADLSLDKAMLQEVLSKKL
jgi:putative transposase